MWCDEPTSGIGPSLQAVFRLLGFPVQVRPGFVVLMLLIIVLYGDEFGLWLAGSLAVLTLIHELGHAMAARRTGAEAEIALDFLAGYASYTPTRPLTRLERAGISFAGPGVQLAVAAAVLLAAGTNPIDPQSAFDSAPTAAIWWAGIGIGLLNLAPVLPLDGGNIALSALDRLLPGRAERVMLYLSLAVTGVLIVLTFTTDRFRGFGLVAAFLLITQLQMLGARRAATSPWDRALEALEAGKPRRARRTLVAALSHPQPRSPAPRFAVSAAQATELVDVLPEPFPSGDPGNELVLTTLLLQLGRYEEAAHYAADSYERTPNSVSAALVARAAAALGDHATALGWLEAAADAGTAPQALARMIDRAPELIGIRQHPDVLAIRRSLTAPTPP